jgi:hypothetical protein
LEASGPLKPGRLVRIDRLIKPLKPVRTVRFLKPDRLDRPPGKTMEGVAAGNTHVLWILCIILY